MTALADLYGWDFRVVSEAMKALRIACTAEKRLAILITVEAENPPEGKRLADLAEQCFREELEARQEPA